MKPDNYSYSSLGSSSCSCSSECSCDTSSCTCSNCPGSSCSCSSSASSIICPCGCESTFPRFSSTNQFYQNCGPVHGRFQPEPKDPNPPCLDPLPEIFPSGFRKKTVCTPAWLKFSGDILCFYASFQTIVPESPQETLRTHLCIIRYYLETSTMEVVEPLTENAGYQQGTIIKKGKIPLPSKQAENQFYTLDHLNIGCNLDFYGRIFHIYGVSDGTRYYLNKQGYRLPRNEPTPIDEFSEKRRKAGKGGSSSSRLRLECGEEKAAAVVEACKTKYEVEERNKRIQDLLNKPKETRTLLKFYAVWDDGFERQAQNDGGCENWRKFNIYYYTLDQTAEIIEIHDPGSGLDCLASFLCRGKLLKTPMDPESDVYKPEDFVFGNILDIYGCEFLITDADKFTKNYLAKHYGICGTPLTNILRANLELGEWVEEKRKREAEEARKNEEELRMTNCENWKPKERWTDKLEGILGFYSKFYEPETHVDACRRFIIRFYLNDFTLKITELPHPNTGFPAGTFLHRTRVPLNPDEKTPKGAIKYIGPKQFYIGNILHINCYHFDLLDTDEATLCLMEKHSELFPQSDICAILTKIVHTERCEPLTTAEVIRWFGASDYTQCGMICGTEFRRILIDYSNRRLNEHELRTLLRTYRVECPPEINMDLLRAAIHQELSKFGNVSFDLKSMERIKYTFIQCDPCRTGNIDRETARGILLAAKIPIDKAYLDLLINRFPAADNCNRINYCELLEFINWKDALANNCFPLATPASVPEVMKMILKPSSVSVTVNYRAFLEQICPNFQCALSEICCPSSPECNDDNDNNVYYGDLPEYDQSIENCQTVNESCGRDSNFTPTEIDYANRCGVSPEDLYGSGFRLPENFVVPDESCFRSPQAPPLDRYEQPRTRTANSNSYCNNPQQCNNNYDSIESESPQYYHYSPENLQNQSQASPITIYCTSQHQ